jgi:hypothetical protein
VTAYGSDLPLPYDRNHDWPVGFFDLLPGQGDRGSGLAEGDGGNDHRRKRARRKRQRSDRRPVPGAIESCEHRISVVVRSVELQRRRTDDEASVRRGSTYASRGRR